MNTSDKVLMWISIVLVVIALLLFGVRVVFAEDIGICTDPKSVNYPGVETLDALKEAGLNPVNDGSCYYLKCVDAGLPGAYSCDMGTADDQNYDDWVNDRLPGMQYGPAYYGNLIEIGGCTDQSALNWMDPQWWPDYNIIDDGSCVYPEPENAL
jgi:hypothetical protein